MRRDGFGELVREPADDPGGSLVDSGVDDLSSRIVTVDPPEDGDGWRAGIVGGNERSGHARGFPDKAALVERPVSIGARRPDPQRGYPG